jgi:hypothetical protein
LKNPKIFFIEIILVIAAVTAGLFYFRNLQPATAPPETPAATDANIAPDIRKVEPTLTEIDLVNTGQKQGTFATDINASWTDADLVGAEPLADFTRADTGRRSMVFHPSDSLKFHPLKPDERRAIGWIRLTDEAPVHVEMSPVNVH